MADTRQSKDTPVEELLSGLSGVSPRDPQAAAAGRARFLAQAQELAPAVSGPGDQRHRGRNINLFERIKIDMHPKLKYSVLATLAILAVIAMVMANNVTTVSAQQVLERAAAAQLSATGGQGIRHERIQVYENPGALPGEDAGKTSIYDNYTDLASGQYRYITQDADGNILSIGASDGDFTYFYFAKDAVPGGSLTIARAPVAADEGVKRLVTVPAEQNRAVFDQFNNNPRVSLEDKITRADGRQAYVLVNPSFQTQKLADGQEETIPTGITRMTFDAETYQLLESQIAVRKDGQDVVIYTAQTLVDELLPEDSPVAWDLSDLANVTFVDEPPADTTDDVSFETLSEEQLAGRAEAYVLS
ncbi:MAG: hypothetical protein VB089_11990, partial [Anaerolineaceae bacterium]|nr:hypothetical protein [Anaerolineaceae bacterium]